MKVVLKILFLVALVILTGIFSINDAFAQVSPNGFIIKNDATGGNCTSIGTWDDVTNTCTLNIDIIIPTDGVGLYIYSQSGITIDGSGHSITGPGTSGIDNDGIRISGQSSNISYF